MQVIHAWFMLVGGLAVFLAVVLSYAWQWLDAAADGTMEEVHRRVQQVIAQGHRPAGESQAEQRARLAKQVAGWVRCTGMALLYGGTAATVIGMLLWAYGTITGVHACPV